MSARATHNAWNVDETLSGCSIVNSFVDIMSEEKVRELQKEDTMNSQEPTTQPDAAKDCDKKPMVSEDRCADDHLLALMLQNEYNHEHDELLLREEKKFNGNDKVALSFENYRPRKLVSDEDSSEDDEDLRESLNQKLDSFKKPSFGSHGVILHNGKLVSKHDIVLCGRDNASRLLEFPPDILTGDAVKIDLQLPNRVYNSLKSHSMSQGKRRNRIHEKKDKSTTVSLLSPAVHRSSFVIPPSDRAHLMLLQFEAYSRLEWAVDAKTRLVLYKMVNSGVLDSVSGIISTGKEAALFHALGGTWKGKDLPKECAIKVFKTTLNEFKNRSEYVQNDYRFRNPRKVMKVWAEKELVNLNRLRRADIPCPEPIRLRNHLLLMSFIGEDGIPAPKLKEVDFDSEELASLYESCVAIMQKMFKDCGLVHGDLSEFNILYWKGDLWIIDVAQAVDISHPRSLAFLARDCENITELKYDKKNPADCVLRSVNNSAGSVDFPSEPHAETPPVIEALSDSAEVQN
ncbi:unnamed protein product [Soboliphyme baturini]|uniref:Serine/threonine-protein kinase RIO3 n=1 Tax=Soboliphyme baturini TaxID=241478 RepID=A0A183ICZ6_9BILA|nr:unnamed protein product [Soboliphyme baturini]